MKHQCSSQYNSCLHYEMEGIFVLYLSIIVKILSTSKLVHSLQMMGAKRQFNSKGWENRTYPDFLNCVMILETKSIGTEKPSPSAPITFIMLTPTTSPSIFTRGPPEFPFRIQSSKAADACQIRV